MLSKPTIPTGSTPKTDDRAQIRAVKSLIRARVRTPMRAYPPALVGVGVVRAGDVIEAAVRRASNAR